jgi:hypothetical protein
MKCTGAPATHVLQPIHSSETRSHLAVQNGNVVLHNAMPAGVHGVRDAVLENHFIQNLGDASDAPWSDKSGSEPGCMWLGMWLVGAGLRWSIAPLRHDLRAVHCDVSMLLLWQ